MDMPHPDQAAASLRVIKVVHTLVWALFAGCIAALPIVVWHRNLSGALTLIVIVAFEVFVLLINRLRCPLTAIAARYTEDRRDNFDIYLPLWLARYNKHIFGTLYAAGILYTVVVWRELRG
jgi:hypothetical protein